MQIVRNVVAGLGVGVVAAVLVATSATAQIIVNGSVLPLEEQLRLGQMGVAPGAYWLLQDGTWGYAGDQTPRGNIYSGQQYSWGHHGSGEQAPDGSWSYYSDVPDYGVGGDGNGCYYTPDWSNC